MAILHVSNGDFACVEWRLRYFSQSARKWRSNAKFWGGYHRFSKTLKVFRLFSDSGEEPEQLEELFTTRGRSATEARRID